MAGGAKRLAQTRRLLPWMIPGGLLVLWLLSGMLHWMPDYLLPPPDRVAAAAFSYICAEPHSAPYAGRFWSDLPASMARVCAGFGLAAALGLPLGILSGRVSAVDGLLSTTLNGVRAVPGICWLPLALVWFGIGRGATIFLVALAAFFPIYLNAADGARRINPLLYRSGAMMGVSALRGIFAILLPACMPQLITGLRLGLGLAWAYLVLGELTGVSEGLGAVIMDARMLGRIDMILTGIIVIAGMGRLSDLLLTGGLKLCFKSARRLA
jgi:sulfonate transport system permease protein